MILEAGVGVGSSVEAGSVRSRGGNNSERDGVESSDRELKGDEARGPCVAAGSGSMERRENEAERSLATDREVGEGGFGSVSSGKAPGKVSSALDVSTGRLVTDFRVDADRDGRLACSARRARSSAFLLDRSDVELSQSGLRAERLDFCQGAVVTLTENTSRIGEGLNMTLEVRSAASNLLANTEISPRGGLQMMGSNAHERREVQSS